ncbi:MAG: tetratricopeptide repeat protein [Prevotellaceae bacterium]|nr:tetratricopeptide repeat protein [Prevotellaceae bacterium]
MKSKVLLLALLSVVTAAGYVSAGDGLKGKVKTVEEFHYSATGEVGELTKGDLMKRIVFKYDEKGNISEEYEYYNDSIEELSDKMTYKYDEKGNKIETKTFLPNGSLYNKSTYRYDEKGNTVEIESRNGENELTYRHVYTHDEKGNLLNTKSHYGFGDETETTFKYDEKGNRISEIHINYSNPGFSKNNVYRYDEKGNKIENNLYNMKGDELLRRIIYRYNEKGENIEIEYSKSDIKTYRYDETGNMIEDISISNGKITGKHIYAYRYDTTGNWIEKTEYVENTGDAGSVYISAEIIERKIEYYGTEQSVYASVKTQDMDTVIKQVDRWKEKENYIEAIELLEENITLFETGDSIGALAWSRLGDLYYKTKDYEKARTYCQKYLDFLKPHLESNPAKYMSNYAQAEKYCLEAKEIREKALGKEHPLYAWSLQNLYTLYLSMGDYEKTITFKNMTCELSIQIINRNFSFMSEQQRSLYWKTQAKDFEAAYSLSRVHPVDATNTLNYNNTLFTK